MMPVTGHIWNDECEQLLQKMFDSIDVNRDSKIEKKDFETLRKDKVWDK